MGGADEDVQIWTSIVSRWLDAVQGEPSMQLIYIASLLRATTIEWYCSMEMRTGCPSDWTTLCQAMLEHFGLSIRAAKARATLLQMTQGKMTILQYADAFESYLAQLEDYDKSFFMAKFIFGLHSVILTEVFVKRPATLLEAKRIVEELELTRIMVKMNQKSGKEKTTKIAQHRGTQERRSERLHQSFQLRTPKMKTCKF